MTIDAVNGPHHHHRRRIKFIFCSFRKRARETHALYLESSFRARISARYVLLSDARRDSISLSLYMCVR